MYKCVNYSSCIQQQLQRKSRFSLLTIFEVFFCLLDSNQYYWLIKLRATVDPTQCANWFSMLDMKYWTLDSVSRAKWVVNEWFSIEWMNFDWEENNQSLPISCISLCTSWTLTSWWCNSSMIFQYMFYGARYRVYEKQKCSVILRQYKTIVVCQLRCQVSFSFQIFSELLQRLITKNLLYSSEALHTMQISY